MIVLHTSVLSPFEGPDEGEHFAYVLKLRQTGAYPSYADFETTAIHQQVGQPPLYYTAATLFSLPFYSAEGLDAGRVKRNPWNGFNAPATSTDNRNFAMMNPAYHALEPDQQRLSETLLVTRRVSILFGWLALAGIYWGGMALWKDKNWALFAALLFAFSPQILQTFSTLTNDAAVIAFSSLVTGASLHLFTRPYDRKLLLFAAVLVTLASLSKVSGLVMGAVPVFALFLGFWCDRTPQRNITHLAQSLLIIVGIPLVFAGWWYARSYILYGDLLGTQPHQQMHWGFAELQPVQIVLQRLPLIAQTLWFNAGWGEVRPETWGYVFPTLVVVLSMIGWAFSLHRPRLDPRLLLLLFTLVIGFIALLRWMQMSNLITGRLYLPYTAALVLIVVWGIKHVPLAHYWRTCFAGASGAIAVIYAAAVIYPAFGAPVLMDHVPHGLQGSPVDFGVARFLGYEIDSDVLVSGEDRHVKLCWQAPPQDTPVPFPFALQVIAAADREQVQAGEPTVASRESYTGMGRYTLWQANKVFCDEFRLPMNNEIPLEAGREYTLYLTLFDPVSLAGLPTLSGNKVIGHLTTAQ